MTKITELERFMLERINEDYKEVGIENTEFYNTFGNEAETNKELRGAFTSLKRKKIVSHYNDPNCFNPIYPTKKFIEVLNELGIEVSQEAVSWVRYDEMWEQYCEEYNAWVEENNMFNWRDEEENATYYKYPFKRWLKETHYIEV